MEAVDIGRTLVAADEPVTLEPLVVHLVGQVVGTQLDLGGDIVVEAHDHLEVIVDLEVDDVADVGKDGLQLGAGHHPENLVEKVNAPVIEHTAALFDVNVPVVHIAVIAVDAGLDGIDVAERTGVKDSLCGAEVGVKTALVMHRELDAGLLTGGGHLVELFEAHGDGLLTDDVFSGLGGLDDEIVVRGVVADDQHDVDVGIVDQLVVVFVALQARRYILELFGVDIRESDQRDPREIEKHLFMLMSHKSVSDDTDSDIFHSYFLHCKKWLYWFIK